MFFIMNRKCVQQYVWLSKSRHLVVKSYAKQICMQSTVHTGLPNFGSSETLGFCWPGLPEIKKWNKHYLENLCHPDTKYACIAISKSYVQIFKKLYKKYYRSTTVGPRRTSLASCQPWLTQHSKTRLELFEHQSFSSSTHPRSSIMYLLQRPNTNP